MKAATMPEPVHEGRNVKRIREILGIKQDALAFELGLSQQAVSQMEQKEKLEPELLQKVASQLGVPVEAIKNFSEEKAVNFISNTFHDNSAGVNNHYNFNPIDKIVELYDALLKSEREKIALLERMMEEKK
ncbi:helix-turn-helix domain-containing protein [Cesiribacter andamanensis]|uniref:Putative transcriptional regulator n=1 Tax=Cesiribacter andamanensis AMV16 TaxID=1279009 RepID=M7N688_9BACT|nr:helix-turn-helix transcriptional regulator [Cesiribacter andamanensis]EMR04148.1 putative transcriptional regulator [Cesiribacter andamanensis AMV16]